MLLDQFGNVILHPPEIQKSEWNFNVDTSRCLFSLKFLKQTSIALEIWTQGPLNVDSIYQQLEAYCKNALEDYSLEILSTKFKSNINQENIFTNQSKIVSDQYQVLSEFIRRISGNLKLNQSVCCFNSAIELTDWSLKYVGFEILEILDDLNNLFRSVLVQKRPAGILEIVNERDPDLSSDVVNLIVVSGFLHNSSSPRNTEVMERPRTLSNSSNSNTFKFISDDTFYSDVIHRDFGKRNSFVITEIFYDRIEVFVYNGSVSFCDRLFSSLIRLISWNNLKMQQIGVSQIERPTDFRPWEIQTSRRERSDFLTSTYSSNKISPIELLQLYSSKESIDLQTNAIQFIESLLKQLKPDANYEKMASITRTVKLSCFDRFPFLLFSEIENWFKTIARSFLQDYAAFLSKAVPYTITEVSELNIVFLKRTIGSSILLIQAGISSGFIQIRIFTIPNVLSEIESLDQVDHEFNLLQRSLQLTSCI